MTTRNKIATKTIDTDARTVTWEFSDGEQIVFDLTKVSPEIFTHHALHGASQRGGDSYSGESDLAVAKAKLKAVIERAYAGEWRAVREGSGGGRITDLAQAIATITKRSIEEVVAMLVEKSDEDKKNLRKNPHVKRALLKIKEQRLERELAEASGEDEALNF